MGQVSFAIDGTVAFTVGENLHLVRAGRTQVVPLGYYANTAPISPDGNAVVFNNADDQLWLLDLQGNTRARLTDGEHGFHSPQWSPDGRRLLYQSLGGEGFVYDRFAGTVTAFERMVKPRWSPDGATVVFARYQTEGPAFVGSDLCIASVAEGTVRQISNTTGSDECEPAFSPDGASVVFRDMRTSRILRQGIYRASEGLTLAAQPAQAVVSSLPTSPSTFRAARLLRSTGVSQLDIPYVHQCYDTPDWHNGNSSCAPTAAIMVLAYYHILPEWDTYCSTPYVHWNPWGSYIADKYCFREVDYANFTHNDPSGRTAWGGYGYMWSTGSPHSRMANYYRSHGLTASQMDYPPHSLALAEVQAGRPYTICAMLTSAGHLVIAHGVGAEEHTFVYNDPYGNKNLGYKNYSGKNAQYDWPGYNNGFQNLSSAEWAIGVSYTPPAVADTLVDDLQFTTGFYLHTKAPASMTQWRDRQTGIGGHCWTMQSTSADTCYATWTATLPHSGTYLVEAYVPSYGAGQARYRVQHEAGTAEVLVDQVANVNAWVSLGTYDFAGSSSVRLGSGSPVRGQVLVVDAVRWTAISTTGVRTDPGVPITSALSQNYPNPFNPQTVISYQLSVVSKVDLRVYDLLGREVAMLVNEEKSPGTYSVTFNASGLASGVYVYRLQAGEVVVTKRLVLVK